MLCALDYVELIRNKIIQQDFSYQDLSPEYKKWKQEHFPLAKTFWHLGGDLVQAIQAVRFDTRTWAATILPSVMDSGGKSYGRSSRTSILTYARVVEEGWEPLNIPARPLFAPTNEEYMNNGFIERIEEVRKKLIANWKL